MEDREQKMRKLSEYLAGLGSVAVAFSGGVDSTFLLQAAKDVLGDGVIALTAVSDFFPDRERREADAFCRERGIRQIICREEILKVPGVAENPANRCYLCKRALFEMFLAQAKRQGFSHVAEGSNLDDLGDYRPGLQAIGYLPPANFDAIFLLRHAAAHFAAIGIGVRYLIDWAMFVRRYHRQIDWTTLERIAEEENMHRFLHCMNAFATDCLGIDPALFPTFPRDHALEERVLQDILHPRFPKRPPKGNMLQVLWFKLRRWWTYRWKHGIVYRESQLRLFLTQGWSLLRGPKPM